MSEKTATPTKPGWYWYEEENYRLAPVHVDWCGFIESGDPDLRQLEVESACGEECYQPLGAISKLDGVWGDAEILPPEELDRLKASNTELLDILDRLVMYYNPGEDRPEALFKLEAAKELLAKAETK